MSEPAHVTAERARLAAQKLAGAVDGYHHAGSPQPSFFNKPVNRLTAYERGYVYGVWLHEFEQDENL